MKDIARALRLPNTPHLKSGIAEAGYEITQHYEGPRYKLTDFDAVLGEMGDFEGAQEHMMRALDIDAATSGPEHPEVASDLNSLGSVLRDFGDLDAAREHVQRALDIARDRLGEEHPTTLRYRRNLESLPR